MCEDSRYDESAFSVFVVPEFSEAYTALRASDPPHVEPMFRPLMYIPHFKVQREKKEASFDASLLNDTLTISMRRRRPESLVPVQPGSCLDPSACLG